VELDTGVVQLPCPEHYACGGVFKRLLLSGVNYFSRPYCLS
jgi:hypothetical protein